MKDKELFDAEAYNNDDFPKALRDVFTYDGEQMLMVQEASGLLFNYRKDLLQKYGVPEPPLEGYDWDTLPGPPEDDPGRAGRRTARPTSSRCCSGPKKGVHSNLHIVQTRLGQGRRDLRRRQADLRRPGRWSSRPRC